MQSNLFQYCSINTYMGICCVRKMPTVNRREMWFCVICFVFVFNCSIYFLFIHLFIYLGWGCNKIFLCEPNATVTPRRVALTCVKRVVKFCHTSSHARDGRRMILSRFANVVHVWTFSLVLIRSHTLGCDFNIHKTFCRSVCERTRCSTSEVRS